MTIGLGPIEGFDLAFIQQLPPGKKEAGNEDVTEGHGTDVAVVFGGAVPLRPSGGEESKGYIGRIRLIAKSHNTEADAAAFSARRIGTLHGIRQRQSRLCVLL